MKTNSKSILLSSLTLLLLLALVSPTYGESGVILLTPDTGISTITIEGSGFTTHSVVTIYWNSEPIPTLPLHVITDDTGAFTCIITAYDQTHEGDHEVKAIDEAGTTALATFTVVNVQGPAGEQGPPGDSAEGLSPGYFAGFLLIAAAVGGLMGVLLGRSQRDEVESLTESTMIAIGS
jgi:hypothetical protein